MAQFYVDSTFASTWGRAADSVAAGDSSRKAQGWWKKEKVDQHFSQTVADICKFVIESAHEGNTFFNKEGDLARDPKF